MLEIYIFNKNTHKTIPKFYYLKLICMIQFSVKIILNKSFTFTFQKNKINFKYLKIGINHSFKKN